MIDKNEMMEKHEWKEIYINGTIVKSMIMRMREREREREWKKYIVK